MKIKDICLRWTSCALTVKMLWFSKIHYLFPPDLSDVIGKNSESYTEISHKPLNFCVWHEIGSWLCSPVKAVANSPTSNVSQCVAFWCSVLILAVDYCIGILLWIGIDSLCMSSLWYCWTWLQSVICYKFSEIFFWFIINTLWDKLQDW